MMVTPVVSMKNGTSAAVVVVNDIAVPLTQEATAKTTKIPAVGSAILDVDASKALHVTTVPDFASPKRNV